MLHCTTGRDGVQPRNDPIGSTRSTDNRISSPPSWPCQRESTDSVSRVTPCTTILPPTAIASQQAPSTPGVVAPPPTKMASGGWSPVSASGVALNGDRAASRIRAGPLDADRPGAGADIPQQMARYRREPGECSGPG